MIIDLSIELQNIESQPEVIGLLSKIATLKAKRTNLFAKYQKLGIERILTDIQEIDNDLAMFEGIILFWQRNYEMVANLKKYVELRESQIKEVESLKTFLADQADVIDSWYKEQLIMNDILLKHFEGERSAKMEASLNILAMNVKRMHEIAIKHCGI